MAKERKFYLDEAKTQEIAVSWTGIWKNVTITHNGEFVGSFPDMKTLKQGGRFVLKDGSPLGVYLSTDRDSPGLRIDHNGQPLKGTVATPQQKLAGVFAIACVIGGLNFVMGALGQFGVSEMLAEMGANWILMIIGAAIIGLGYLAWKKVSAMALTAIIVILLIDIVAAIYFSVESGGRISFTGAGLKVLFIIQFARGYKAIGEYNDQQEAEQYSANNTPQQPS